MILKDNDLVFAKIKPEATIPTKDNENAGYDIYACFYEDYMVIPPHSTKLIPTGIASALSEKYYLQVHERGSTGSKGMKYGAGVVDSSYRGEIFVCINNINDTEIIISKLSLDELINKYGERSIYDNRCVLINYDGGRTFLVEPNNHSAIIYPYEKAIAQLIVHEVPKMDVKEITYEELQNIPSKRGIGALGSTGK